MGRKNAACRQNGDDGFPSPADAAVKLVELLLKGDQGFVERRFKGSCSFAGGTRELLTPPETFAWLLEAPGIGGSGGGGGGGVSATGEFFWGGEIVVGEDNITELLVWLYCCSIHTVLIAGFAAMK